LTALLFLKTVKGYRVGLIAICLIATGLGILLPATFDNFRNFGNLSEELPREMQALFKSEGNLLFASGAQGYIAIVFRHPIILVAFAAFAIAVASGAIAREIERKTVFILLARPLPRYQLLLSRWSAMVPGVALLGGALLLGIAIGVAISDVGEVVVLERYLFAWASAFMLFLAIGSYAFLFSASARDGTQAVLFSTALTVLFFLMDFLAGLWEPLGFLGPMSLFHYYDPVTAAIEASIPAQHVAVLLGVTAVSLAASVVVFQRRDIT